MRLGRSHPSDARISRCGTYRYALWRRWAAGPQVLFVMLNPSTADATADDPTIRRCIGFARRWGFAALAVGNLFAYRTPSPRVLRSARHPVGRANDRWLERLAAESSRVVAAWGNHGSLRGRDAEVRRLLGPLYALALTRQGQPRHPLYSMNISFEECCLLPAPTASEPKSGEDRLRGWAAPPSSTPRGLDRRRSC